MQAFNDNYITICERYKGLNIVVREDIDYICFIPYIDVFTQVLSIDNIIGNKVYMTVEGLTLADIPINDRVLISGFKTSVYKNKKYFIKRTLIKHAYSFICTDDLEYAIVYDYKIITKREGKYVDIRISDVLLYKVISIENVTKTIIVELAKEVTNGL